MGDRSASRGRRIGRDRRIEGEWEDERMRG